MNKRMILCACRMAVVSFILVQPVRAQVHKKISITNTSSVRLTDKAISVKRAQLAAIPKGIVYPLILSAKGDTIPAQLDDLDGDGNWDELFFVATLSSNSTQTFSFRWAFTQPHYTKRTSVRFGKRTGATTPVQPATDEIVYALDMPKRLGFQRYQTDGPSWENDKVGFRHYLDGRNAKDVFGKRTSFMSPEQVGINTAGAVEDNYHVMEAWGRDILAVGNSVGIGGIALMKKDSIMRLGVTVDDTINNVEKTTFRIVSEGPVRSIMNLRYDNWKPANKPYSVEEITSIWPGMYAYQNSVKVGGLEGDENLLVGMVSINAVNPPKEVRTSKKWVALVSHEKHTYNKEWWLGLALILPADAYLGYIEAPKTGKLSNSFLAKLKIGSKPVGYFSVAGWEISDKGFKEEAYFRQYVENLVAQLSAEIKISVK